VPENDSDGAASSPAAEAAETAEAAWYAGLPTMFGSAAALFTDPAGRVLLVKPNYREHWSLPGGILEHGEPPHLGCRREVAEEVGLDIAPGPLLAIDWTPPEGVRPRAMVAFIFDGGVLPEHAPIRLQEEELDGYRFVEPGELASYLPAFLATRVGAALAARATGAPVYVPQLDRR
jgi:ADP-ribose pyrophosphatase YjhB (NUDIX family)